jgi:putative N6-adenine-specific DNA methylase
MSYNFCVPCLFGVEGITASELRRLSFKDVSAQNGKVLFTGEKDDIARANINIRTGERVLINIGTTKANTFDMLFEGVKAMPWERYVQADGAFPVKGYALNSSLHSIPDCQKIVKKAIVERLKLKYNLQWFTETGPKYQVRFSIMNDIAELYIDTSGTGLHKRGYRPVGNAAPLKETLAAAIIELSRYRGRGELCDEAVA